MHDAKALRADVAGFAARLRRRGGFEEFEVKFEALDGARRTAQARVQEINAGRNALAKRIAAEMRAGVDVEALKQEGTYLGLLAARADEAAKAADEAMRGFLAALPNLPADEVPDGTDEAGNVEIDRRGTPRPADEALAHWTTGPAFGIDAEAGVRLAGTRSAVLRGPAARLERALGRMMVETHAGEHGYEEVSPPLVVLPEILEGTGQLPKFEEDLFRAGRGFLIPTAEVPLTNLVRGQALDRKDLPMRLTALTPCFRAEAGAAGRDARGLIRQHQFLKCELVSIAAPEDAEAELDRMAECARTILDRLELPNRKVLLCAGDMGFSARKTYDFEVWMPGQDAWREISSCSDCGTFQAARMGTKLAGGGRPHTLNGSGVAVGRALAALLETHLQADGRLRIPEALRPFLGGAVHLDPR